MNFHACLLKLLLKFTLPCFPINSIILLVIADGRTDGRTGGGEVFCYFSNLDRIGEETLNYGNVMLGNNEVTYLGF